MITEWFTIEKRVTDLIAEDPAGIYDLVYFDAFGPDKQPEMWKPDMISNIAALTRPGSVFVTYSAKGNLKRMLRSLGFDVTHLPGPPGKESSQELSGNDLWYICATETVMRCNLT